MFDVFYIGNKPDLFAHEQECESIPHAQALSRTRYCWIVTYLADYSGWDWLWEPVPWQGHQQHAWASQWQKDSGTYLVPKHSGADVNYHVAPIITRLAVTDNWTMPHRSIDVWDTSWHPDPTEPPMVYQFGTQHQKSGGPVYTVPGGQDIKYVTAPRATVTSRDDCWIIPDGIDVDSFDWTWHPDDEPPMIYQFGTQHQKTGGPKYVSPGAQNTKYIGIYATTTSCSDCWVIPDGLDVDSFDWTWHPDSTDQPYIYEFGTQHQRTGGPKYMVPGAVDTKFAENLRIRSTYTSGAYVIDHLDGAADRTTQQVERHTQVLKRVRYFDNYLDTLKRIANAAPNDQEWIWIVSSLCDYTVFDFSWHPERWQSTMLHVFPSSGQKFGDTFFMHVPTFRERSARCQLLEWYDLNFITDCDVPRRPMPVVRHAQDTHVDAVKTQNWLGPLAVFTTAEYLSSDLAIVPLWREQTKTVVALDSGGATVIIPKTAVPYIRTQIYDYPYIERDHMLCAVPLDVVFISNGERNAEFHYNHLAMCLQEQPNRLHRVDGINGRVAAYHAALEASTTPWALCVFAKLRIDVGFPWDWQPDRLQAAKHYIFNAKNPVNGLEYGHQAMIAYNKKLVLANTGTGLDFTLDQAHEVVPILSGTAYYDTTPWSAWRTAFREVIKLRASLPDVESEYRLDRWLNFDNTNQHIVNEEWSRYGARDAIEYYDAVQGNFTELRKSYEWSWLASYAMLRRNLLPD